jgi:hypothetical protein
MRVQLINGTWICESNNQVHTHQKCNKIDSVVANSIHKLLQAGIIRPSNIQFCLKQDTELQKLDTPTLKEIASFIRRKKKSVIN